MRATHPDQCMHAQSRIPCRVHDIVVIAVIIAVAIKANISTIEHVANVLEIFRKLRLTLAFVNVRLSDRTVDEDETDSQAVIS